MVFFFSEISTVTLQHYLQIFINFSLKIADKKCFSFNVQVYTETLETTKKLILLS